MNAKEKLIRIVQDAKGDDLERARHSFRGLSDEDLDRQYGQSGQTCRQILAEYENERALYDAAYDLLMKKIDT